MVTRANRLTNTEWVSLMDDHADTFSFMENSFFIHRCFNRAQTFHGSYSLLKDTIFIKERSTTPAGDAEYYRLKFLIAKDQLLPYSREKLVNHQWAVSKNPLRKDFVFKKLNQVSKS